MHHSEEISINISLWLFWAFIRLHSGKTKADDYKSEKNNYISIKAYVYITVYIITYDGEFILTLFTVSWSSILAVFGCREISPPISNPKYKRERVDTYNLSIYILVEGDSKNSLSLLCMWRIFSSFCNEMTSCSSSS